MKRYGKSRRQLFDELDRPVITPLPIDRFLHGDWSRAQAKSDPAPSLEHENIRGADYYN